MRRGVLWAVPLVVGLAVACSDTTIPEADLVGTWNATRFIFSDFGDPVTDFNVIATGGSVQIVIRANNTYTLTFTLAGSTDTEDGTWSVSGSTLTFDAGTADVTVLEASLSGNTLTIHTEDVEFDFGNGDEPAQLDATFTRQ